MSNRSEFEDKEVNQLKRLIRETPISVDLVEQIMTKVESSHPRNTRSHRTHRRSGWGGAMITVASVVMLFSLVIGSGFVSPTMAASIRQIPGMDTIFRFAGDLGLRSADEKGLVTILDASDTHDGLTLNVPAVMFDGTRVSIGIERKTSEQKFLEDTVQGNISNIKLLSINGESFQSYAPWGHSINPYMNPGKDKNTTILQFSDLENQGGKAFPDQFELTLIMTVSGISEPFKFNIPVEMNTKDNLVLTPSISRKYQNINLEYEKIEFTLFTTNLTTRIELPKNMKIASFVPSLDYDMIDEKGNNLKLIDGNGTSATDGNVLIMDSRFEPFESMPKSITIKPYKNIMQKGDKSQFVLDENGDPKKEYFPALEITLPIK